MTDNPTQPAPQQPTTKAHSAHSQANRWTRYGLNTAVLILALLVIVVLLNAIAYNHFVRFDFTATRKYSLSPQTQKLLKNLDRPIEITTLYVEGTIEQSMRQRIEDLLDEYARRSGNVTVRKIDPSFDVEQYQQFTGEIRKQYSAEIDAFTKAFESAGQVYQQVRQFAEEQSAQMAATVPNLQKIDPLSLRNLQTLNSYFSYLAQVMPEELNSANETIKQPFPNLDRARRTVVSRLTEMREAALQQAARQFEVAADDDRNSDDTKDYLLGLSTRYRALLEQVGPIIEKLEGVRFDKYDEIRGKIARGNSIVVASAAPAAAESDGAATNSTGDGGMVVLSVDDVFPIFDRGGAEQTELTRDFRGEQTLTGAILGVTQKVKPKIVFLNARPESALAGNQPGYSMVAERLRSMNFEVDEWNPAGRMGPMGQPMPPGPKPVAEPGQTMIFVSLPAPPPNPQMPFNPATMEIQQALKDHLAAGQPAIVMLQPSQMAAFGQPDTSADFLKDWGITAELGRPVLTLMPTGDGRTLSSNEIRVTDWPAGHPVSNAIRGLQGIHVQAAPLLVAETPPQDVTVWPLIRTPVDSWGESDPVIGRQTEQATKDASDTPGPLTTAAAAEKRGQRVVVIADPYWAANFVVRAGPMNPLTGEPLYAAFPANAELFVNSCYWLAGLDELIATSAAAQDVRRIGEMTPGVQRTMWWVVLAGLPIACLASGGVVWLVRKK